MANYGYNMTQARLIVAIPRRFPKLLQMNESSGVDDMSGLSELPWDSIPTRLLLLLAVMSLVSNIFSIKNYRTMEEHQGYST